MKKNLLSIRIIIAVVCVCSILFFSWLDIMEICDTQTDEIGDDVHMDMSSLLDEHVSYANEYTVSDIYNSGLPLRENMDLKKCGVTETARGVVCLDRLCQAFQEDGILGLQNKVDWERVGTGEKSLVTDNLERLVNILSSGDEIFLVQETDLGNACVIQLCSMHLRKGIVGDQLYDYANAKYMSITIYYGEGEDFTILPYSIV